MSKKILASLLAVASILSVSAVAFATDSDASEASSAPATTKAYDPTAGANYTVTAPVSYGTVDATVPVDLNSIVVNPYRAAIKTTLDDSSVVKNNAFVASKVYEVKNNSTEANDGIKVMATTSVTKATGLVVVDGTATTPDGWAAAGNTGTWNPLYTYDKITAKKQTDGSYTYTGGALSTKQGNNVAIKLVGSTVAAANVVDSTKTTNSTVWFKAKGTNTGELGTAAEDSSVWFTVSGELSDKAPCADEGYAWAKENLALSIVLKVVPADTTPAP